MGKFVQKNIMKTTVTSLSNQNKNNKLNVHQLITRLTIAVVMWPHGAQLLPGLFGGYGFTNTMSYFTGQAGLPWLVGFIVIMAQFFGSLFILCGLFTRLNAFVMSVIAVGMIFSGHVEHGFFMNWFGNQKGEGFEFHLLLLGLCLSLVFTENYAFSLDHILKKKTNIKTWIL